MKIKVIYQLKKKKAKQNDLNKKKEKRILLKAYMHFLMVEKNFLDDFSGIFPQGPTESTVHSSDLALLVKIITPKQMLQKLPLPFAKVKPRNTYENLLNEILQIIYSLYREISNN